MTDTVWPSAESASSTRGVSVDSVSSKVDPVRRFVLVRTVLPVWVVFGLVTVAASLGWTPSLEVGFALVLLSVLVVGLPHGAVDHLFVARLGVDRPLLVVATVYAVLGGAYVAGWFVAPVAAFVGFVLLTWLHWGLGDLYSVVALSGGEHLRSRAQRALTAAVRGAIPMLVPFVFHPEEFRTVATLVVGSFETTATAGLSALFTPGLRTAVGVALALGVSVSVVRGLSVAGRLHLGTTASPSPSALRDWAVDTGETLLLLAFFAVVPPVVAIGLYFPLWHSLRHVLRIVLLDPPAVDGIERGTLLPGGVRFARRAAPFTVGGIAVLVALFVLVPGSSASLEGAVAVYLVTLAVLTLPHAAVAAWGDWRQSVWATPR